jgi:pimeloyl-ACP methyl ester carboxylesterase
VPFLTAGGHRLEYERVGRADPGRPVLVFLHEGLGSVSQWRDFPERLARDSGYPGLVYSRRGYGRSDPVELPRPLTYMHDEARRVLPEVLAEAGIDDAILVGHSDGASIAVIYAGENGARLRGLVLLAPHVYAEDVGIASIAQVNAEYGRTELREKLARHHGTNVDGAFHGWADAWLDPGFRAWNLEAFLPGITVPVLVIQGREDQYGTLAQVDAIERQVGGPHERLILSPCGHSPQRDRPEETAAAIVRFVRGLRSGTAGAGG